MLFAGGRKILHWSSTLKHLSKPFIRPDWHILWELWRTEKINLKKFTTFSKKLKGNLPIWQLVSHLSKKAMKQISCSCRELSWTARGVDAIVISTNTHAIASDCHWLLILDHEEITSDYRQYYPLGNASCNVSCRRNLSETLFVWRNNLPYLKHLPEDFSVFSQCLCFTIDAKTLRHGTDKPVSAIL